MMAWEGFEAVVPKKVVNALAEKLGDETYMVAVVKPVEKMDAFVPIEGIPFLQFLQDTNFDL